VSGAIRVLAADLGDPAQAEAVVRLVDGYARDPMGGGEPLAADARARLLPGLRAEPGTRVWLAFSGDEAVGVAVCFLSFCTFEARRLINVHDLAVAAGHRRRGVARRLLEAVEAGARALGCCRITLEVREDNAPARALYARFGMAGLEYAGVPETTLFLAKPIQVR